MSAGRFDEPADAPGDSFELSAAQRGIWFAQQSLGQVAINIAQYVELFGSIDLDTLTRASRMVGREMGSGYLSLVETDALPLQYVDRSIDDSIALVDVSGAQDPEQTAQTWMRDEYRAHVDLLSDRLTTSTLIRLGDDHYYWYIRTHHIALDGFGAMATVTRIAEVYTALIAGDEIPPGKGAELSEVVAEERRYRDSDRFVKDRDYWAQRTVDLPAPLSLAQHRAAPGDYSRVASMTLPDDTAQLLDEAAREAAGSTAPAVIAAFAAYLARMTDSEDIVLSLPVSARNTAKLRRAGGMVSNIVPLRLTVSPETTIEELTRTVQTELTGALRRQLYRHEDMRRDIGQGTGQRGLFGPSVNLMMFKPVIDLGDVVGHTHVLTTGPVEDLSMNIYPGVHGSNLRVDFEANPQSYSDDELRRHHDRFIDFLGQVLRVGPDTTVGALNLGSPAEIAATMEQWNSTEHPVEVRDLTQMWARQVALTPEAIAIVDAGRRMSFAEFDAWTNRLARRLIAVGVGPDVRVGVALRRSLDMMAALYAVLKAGGAYVPIDPDHPSARIADVLATAEPACVLAAAGDHEKFVDPAVSVIDPQSLDLTGLSDGEITNAERSGPLTPNTLAYVLFTSGSTGKPKGVAVPHGAVVNQLEWIAGHYGVGPSDVVLQKTPTTFDVSVWELFSPAVGSRMVVAKPDGHLDPEYLAQVMVDEGVTATSFVPAMLQLFLGSGGLGDAAALRLLLVAGEAFPAKLAAQARLALPAVRIENLYGPTEFTVHATYAPVDSTVVQGVPIGRPVWNCRAWVLDRQLRPCVVGAVGELYLSGAQLARGYFGRPDLTAERFVPCVFGPPGTRMYRTGDLVRWNAAGSLEYVGRSDFQVKVRGLRIELGEIESAVLADEAVRETVVVVHQSTHGQRLVAYVVGGGAALDTARLMNIVRARVPEYMVPDAVVELPQMPLGPSGKVDRKALPEPDFSAHAVAFRAPITDAERAIAAIVGDLLGHPEVGLDDSFFGLGGDSIMSIQLVSRARAVGFHFSSRDVFECKTIGELAAAASDESSAAVVDELPGGGTGSVDLTPIVAWMSEVPESVGPYSQSVVVPAPAPFDMDLLRRTVAAVVAHHDVLRSRLYIGDDGRPEHVVVPESEAPTVEIAERSVGAAPGTAGFDEQLTALAESATEALNPAEGRIMSVTVVESTAEPETSRRLLIVLHHLAVDGVSWRILLPDLATAWAQLAAGEALALPAVGTSMRRWARGLNDLATDPRVLDELDHWRSTLNEVDDSTLTLDRGRDVVSTLRHRELTLSTSLTDTLLTRVPQAFHGGVNDGLLAALTLATTHWLRARGATADSVVVTLEAHGREEDLLPGADLSRTVGWFTTMYPVALRTAGIDIDDALAGGTAAGDLVKAVKEQLAAVPRRGVGYGLLRHLSAEGMEALSSYPEPVITFNYLGRLAGGGLSGPWVPDGESALRGTRGADVPVRTALDINAVVTESAGGPQLSAEIDYPAGVVDDEQVDELIELWQRALESIALHAVSAGAGGLTPSDLDLVDLGQPQIEELEARFDDIADVWPLTPLQNGLLFHAELAAGDVDVYAAQMILDLSGLDPERMRRSAESLIARHPNLRSAFFTDSSGSAVAVIPATVQTPWTDHDLTDLEPGAQEVAISELTQDERLLPFAMDRPPLIRFTMIKRGDSSYRFVITNHHILLDGWSLPIFMSDLLALYRAGGDPRSLTAPSPYRNYLTWLHSQSTQQSLDAWRTALDGVEEPTLLFPGAEAHGRGQVPRQIEVVVADDLMSGITDYVRESGVTLNTVLQTAWAIVLSRLTGSDDVVFGTTVSGRPPQVTGIESMLGLFINTLPVRVVLDPGTDLAGLVSDDLASADRTSRSSLRGVGGHHRLHGRRFALRHDVGLRVVPVGPQRIERRRRHRRPSGRSRRCPRRHPLSAHPDRGDRSRAAVVGQVPARNRRSRARGISSAHDGSSARAHLFGRGAAGGGPGRTHLGRTGGSPRSGRQRRPRFGDAARVAGGGRGPVGGSRRRGLSVRFDHLSRARRAVQCPGPPSHRARHRTGADRRPRHGTVDRVHGRPLGSGQDRCGLPAGRHALPGRTHRTHAAGLGCGVRSVDFAVATGSAPADRMARTRCRADR